MKSHYQLLNTESLPMTDRDAFGPNFGQPLQFITKEDAEAAQIGYAFYNIKTVVQYCD